MTSVTLKPSEWTLAWSCPCRKDAEGNRESHSPACYRWEISPAYWTRRGWKWKTVAPPWAALQKSGTHGVAVPTSPGAACRDVSHQEQGVFPRSLDPSPWLAGIVQPTPVFRGSRQTGSGTIRRFLQYSTYSTPAVRGTTSSGRSRCLSQEVRIPSATKECLVMPFRLRGWEGGWRCVGPRSGDTITAMSSRVLIPEPVRAWWDWGHQSWVSTIRLLFLRPGLCVAFFCQTDNGVLASCKMLVMLVWVVITIYGAERQLLFNELS